MGGIVRSKPSPALVVALLALFVALSGTATALSGRNNVDHNDLQRHVVHAAKIHSGAVKTGKLAADAVRSPKVKDGSLLAADFRAGEIPVTFFASARADGTQLSASPGVSVTKYMGQTGAYQVVLPQDVTECVAVANIGESTGNGLPAGEATSRTNGRAVPALANTVDVVTRNSAGTATDLPFNVAVLC